ncbi:hypothetical protein ANO11243_000040 [Dothideomycetidae sp. 11243]|nr:hypothetical protein ANO11243_000040 [fungal sp. No.11243]
MVEASVEIEYDTGDSIAFTSECSVCTVKRGADPLTQRLVARELPQDEQQSPNPNTDIEVPEDDPRSPLERFRTRRKRPMSVTDLVSPAWCELQYFYSLAKYGRVKRTPAMRQGSRVHKVLEEEVHVVVPVEVTTSEDRFGLRIWNVIQGLRTLRATGMTRELEVWGHVQGEVVNGVIDELTYTCPDPAFESALSSRKKSGRSKKQQKESELPPDQTTLRGFLTGSQLEQPISDSTVTTKQDGKQVYIIDVKTRSSRSAPKDEVALRPTYMQLMLYRHLLLQLATDSVSASKVFTRYHVDADAVFSDLFISQIAGLDQHSATYQPFLDSDADSDYRPSTSPTGEGNDPLSELLAHNTLAELWRLMARELASAIPTVGSILRAEFRAATNGAVIGEKIFLHDDRRLETYVRDEIAWWKGERPARGVDIEEAFKCRICSFAEHCDWRKEKVEEGIRKARLRQEERKKSEV